MKNILVMVKSCWKNRARRDAIRDTWFSELDPAFATGVFVVGNHPPITPQFNRLSNLTSETDLWILDVADDFKHIGWKVHAAMQKAARKDYDRVIVVDDDTYLRPERLKVFVYDTWTSDYIGCKEGREYMHGACYIVSSFAIGELSRSSALLNGFPDDPPTGDALRLPHLYWCETNRFRPGPHCDLIPRPDNDIISTHKCAPDEMRSIHKLWNHLSEQQ